jgi:hypothetical protein
MTTWKSPSTLFLNTSRACRGRWKTWFHEVKLGGKALLTGDDTYNCRSTMLQRVQPLLQACLLPARLLHLLLQTRLLPA